MVPSFDDSFVGLDNIRGLMQLSSAVGWMLALAFAIFWLVMLVDCLRRPKFYPVLGTTWRTRLFWLITFVFLNPLITFAYLVFGRVLPPKPKASPPVRLAIIGTVVFLVVAQLWPSWSLLPRPLRFHRDPTTGEMVAIEGNPTSLDLRATVKESSNNQSSSSSTSGNNEDYFFCEHIVVLGRSEHPLMQKVAALLCERLSALPQAINVEYHPPGHRPEVGGRMPDLTVILDALRISEIDLSGYCELTCRIEVLAGQSPWASSHHVSTDDQPPTFDVSFSSSLDHKSRIVGVALGEARYKAVAENIVEQIDGSLLKNLREWSDGHRSPDSLPASFCGEYKPPQKDFLTNRPGWELIMAGAGIFEHNHTIWRFEDERPPEAVLEELKDQLTALDFKAWGDEAYLRATKDDQVLEVFRPNNTRFPSDNPTNKSPMFVAEYRLKFSLPERCRAVEDLLAVATTAEQLLPFRHRVRRCSDGLADRLLARMDELPIRSARSALALAEWHHERGNADTARTQLRKAVTLAWVDNSKRDLEDDLNELGDKLGLEEVAESQPDADELAAAGIPRLGDNSDAIEADLEVGEPLLAWCLSPEGELLVCRGTVLQGTKADEPFRLEVGVYHDGGYVTGSIGISPVTGTAKQKWLASHSVGAHGVRFGATAGSNDGRIFAVEAKLLDDGNTASPATAPAPAPESVVHDVSDT